MIEWDVEKTARLQKAIDDAGINVDQAVDLIMIKSGPCCLTCTRKNCGIDEPECLECLDYCNYESEKEVNHEPETPSAAGDQEQKGGAEA